MAEKPFDVAIVGAGQAGCTLAGKIAETGVRRLPGFHVIPQFNSLRDDPRFQDLLLRINLEP